MDSDLWMVLGVQLLTRLPILAVFGVGITLAVMRWDQHPSVSMLATVGLGLAAVLTAVSTLFSVLPMMLTSDGRSMEDVGTIMSGVSMLMTVLNAGVWVVILVAIFAGREATPKT
jgi:hypothetical protein